MFLPKHPSSSRPWRPCLQPGAPLIRPRPRIPATTSSGRRHLLRPSAAASSGSPSRDSPLPVPPAKRSSKNKPPDEIGRWKAVPPGMRESAGPETETEDPSPPRTALWSARRRARAAWRKVASWVPRKARSLVLLNMVTLIFGDHCPFLGWSYWSRSTCSYMVWSIFITCWCCYTGAKWFSAMCKSDYLHGQVGDLLNLVSAFSFAIHMLRTEHISRNIKKENFLTLVGCEVFVVAILSAASYIFKCFTRNVQHWNFKTWPPSELFGMVMLFPWPAILYTGIFSTAFCLLAEVAAMRDVSATETAIIYGLEPVWGAAFAWAMLGERWGVTGLVGAIFIIAGSLMVQIFGSIPDVSRGDTITR